MNWTVWFVNAKGETVRRVFDSPYKARVFANRVRHSKTCRLLTAPRTE